MHPVQPPPIYIIHLAVGCVSEWLCEIKAIPGTWAWVSLIISGPRLEALLRPALVSINFNLGVLACIVSINQETKKGWTGDTPTHDFHHLPARLTHAPVRLGVHAWYGIKLNARRRRKALKGAWMRRKRDVPERPYLTPWVGVSFVLTNR